jgi:arylformamidase
MPHILSPLITEALPGLWSETIVYRKQCLHKIEDGKLPPVNYDTHIINSHSLTHLEAPSHVNQGGKGIDQLFQMPAMMFGAAVVLKLKGNHYKDIGSGIYLWEVTVTQLRQTLEVSLNGSSFPGKILLTTDFYPTNQHGFHDPNYVLILSQEAADFLTSLPTFNLYGTSWKSSDYKPGLSERPIHKTLFQKAAILECLDLQKVPEGIYFLVAFPLRIQGASESPVCPVLFSKDELKF